MTINGVYHVTLFGELRVVLPDGQATTRFRTHKAASLFAYLAHHPHTAHPREQLTELFWPDLEPEAARDNLSTALSSLRRQLEPPPLPSGTLFQTDRQTVRLQSERVSTDTARWESLLKAAGRTGEAGEKARLLQEALTLYRGEFLPGHYEDWVTREQTRYAELHLNALLQLSEALEETGDREGALRAAQQAGQADPYLEEAVECQMRLLLAMGRPSSALEVYQALAKFLKEQIGASPEPRLRQLAEQIKQDPKAVIPSPKGSVKKAPISRRTTDIREPQQEPEAPVPLPEVPTVLPLPPLPVQMTRFFGRSAEKKLLIQLFQEEEARLITLLGPGGAGKTRLSTETARELQEQSGKQTLFLSFAEVPDAGLMLSSILGTLQIAPKPGTDPIERIQERIGSQPTLLILDNLEHLLTEGGRFKGDGPSASGAGVVVRMLLERLPNVVCLVTSRIALRLGGEHEFLIPPLSRPPQDETSPDTLMEYDSIALFVDRARLARPDFVLAANNAEAVAALARKLEGMPLAIEMAAAWTNLLPPAKILERMQRQLSLLVSRRKDLPPRHQSLRATIEWSYDLLSLELQHLFARLSVFRAGWTLEQAEAVGGSNALFGLEELAQHSLIVAVEQDRARWSSSEENEGQTLEPRYRMLETLREYASEKLTEFGECEEVEMRFISCCASLVEEFYREDNGPRQVYWYRRISEEMDNIRAAFEYGRQRERMLPEILRMAQRMVPYWDLGSYLQEGYSILTGLIKQCADQAAPSLMASALNEAGNLARSLGITDDARRLYEESLAIKRSIGDKRMIASTVNNIGMLIFETDLYAEAGPLFTEALALRREVGDLVAIANSLIWLGMVAQKAQNYEEAKHLFQEVVDLAREIGDFEVLAYALGNLAEVALSEREFVAATRFQQESLELHRKLDNKRGIIFSFYTLAFMEMEKGSPLRTAHLLGAVERLNKSTGFAPPPEYLHQCAEMESRGTAALSEQDWQAALREGYQMTMAAALEYALQDSIRV